MCIKVKKERSRAWGHKQSWCVIECLSCSVHPPPSFHFPLCYLIPHLSLGGGGVWPLSGGKRDQQFGFLPQCRPGATPSAASQRQHGGDGCSREKCWGTTNKYECTSHLDPLTDDKCFVNVSLTYIHLQITVWPCQFHWKTVFPIQSP